MAIEDVRKIGIFYRFLCALISLFCLIALAGVFAFGRDGGFYSQMWVFVAIIGLLLYVSLTIVITGYPPNFLKWTSGSE